MKRKNTKSQQLSIDFDNLVKNENISFQINNKESFNYNLNSGCKVIFFNSYSQRKDAELLNKFYSLSNHLD